MQWLWFFWVPKIFLCNFWYVWLPSQPHQSKSPAKKSDSGTILIKAVPWLLHESTDSTKINRPGHNIHMYWTNFRQPTAHVQQNIFGKTLIEVSSLHLYASFGTFCVQIDQLFAPQWVFKHSEEFRNRRHFPLKTANCRFSNILQRLTVPRIMDQF